MVFSIFIQIFIDEQIYRIDIFIIAFLSRI